MTDLYEQWLERAAILEYCSGLQRQTAEHEAAKMYGITYEQLEEFRRVDSHK